MITECVRTNLAGVQISLCRSRCRFDVRSNFSAYTNLSLQILLCRHNFYAYAQTLWQIFLRTLKSNSTLIFSLFAHSFQCGHLTALWLIFTDMDYQAHTSFCNSNSSILVVSRRRWPRRSVGLHSAGSFWGISQLHLQTQGFSFNAVLRKS